MKILHVTPSFVPARVYGGPIETVYKLCINLKELGLEVRVLTTSANGVRQNLDVDTLKDVMVEGGLPVRYCRRIGRESISLQLLYLLPRYIFAADLVHLTSVYSFPTIPTLLLCTILRKPLIWSPRGAFQEWEGSTKPLLKGLWNYVCRLVAPKSLILHATSDQEANESKAKMPGVKTITIPNGVEVEEVEQAKKQTGVLELLYLGRLHPKKGIENLVDACNKIDKETELDWRLTIAGSGDADYTSTLHSHIESTGLCEHIEMIGQIEKDGKNTLFEKADVLVVPSYTENFAVVVTEALAHGVPVIASHGTPWAELEEQGCGLWVSNDPGSLANAILKVSKMPTAEMGQKGREWMRRVFSWPLLAQEMADVYGQILRTTK